SCIQGHDVKSSQRYSRPAVVCGAVAVLALACAVPVQAMHGGVAPSPIAGSAAAPAAQHAAPSPDARQSLLAAARAGEPGVIQSLHDMVQIESGSDDSAGLQTLADYSAGRLRALGAKVEMVPASNGRA